MEWIILGLVVVIAIYGVTIYNKLVTLKNRYENAFAQIDVQLKRRYDLIPNLVETAKSYMAHERETLEAVTQARNAAASSLNNASNHPGDAAAIGALANAEGALQSAMGRFNMVMEAYPDLKASANMQQFSEELISTENKVAFARQGYNDAVTNYNTYKQAFPPVILAGMLGFKEDAGLLEFDDKEAIQAAPKVSF